MKETKFIEQNKEKWHEFERILQQKKNDPEKLRQLFIELTDDLSYARTFYPNRSVRVYLNQLAQKIYLSVYKTQRNKRGAFRNFWVEEMPYIIYQSRKAFLLSLTIFVVSMAIGVLSSMYDPEFAALILSEGYVEMTLENIEKGDPMGVYKDSGEVGMFTYITINNLRVDFITFISGLLASIGAILVMMYNGIMVGTFQYFFIERGLFWESALTIWVHGSLEIPAIIISGAAGMELGSGLIFPGTLSRFQSFLLSARRGLKILLGVLPITVVAGFIEGFLTRYTEAPALLRAAFILICFSAVVLYYIVYPYFKYKQGFNVKESKDQLLASPPIDMPLETTRSVGQMFADTFTIYGQVFGRILPLALLAAVVYTTYFIIIAYDGFTDVTSSISGGILAEQIAYLSELSVFFNHYMHPLMAPGTAMILLLAASFTGAYIYSAANKNHIDASTRQNLNLNAFFKQHWLIITAFAAGFLGMLFLPSALFWLFIIPVAPYLAVSLAVAIVEKQHFIRSMRRAYTLITTNMGDFIGLHILLLVVSSLFLWVSSTSFVWFYFDFIQMNLLLDADTYPKLIAGFVALNVALGATLVLPIYLFAYTLFYYKAREVQEAPGLLHKLTRIGQQKKLYGLEQEV